MTTKQEFLSLQHSESVVAQMAATIFAGLVQSPQAAGQDEAALIERSVDIAIRMAVRTEKLVASDEEWKRGASGGSPYLAG